MEQVEFYGSSDWGWSLITILFASTAVYLGAGMARSFRVDGATGLAALPHRAFWLEAKALVADGVQFSRHRLRGKAGPSSAGKLARQPLQENELHDGHAGADERRTERRKKTSSTATNNEKRRMGSQHRDGQQAALKSEPVPTADRSSGAADADGTRALGTAASGGGRWVHVPQ